MKISVIGCGYLGAVHATALASLGHEVVGYDIDPARIEALASGRAPFFEPGLDALLNELVSTDRLRFTNQVADTAGAAIHFIAVGTPQSSDGDAADLTFVHAALDALIPHLRPGDLVVGKSTVPVGTAASLATRLAESAPGAILAWNPEFLREGFAIADTLSPDRLVYGLPARDVDAERAEALLDEVYRDALAAGTPKVVTNYETAELVKVAANAFLATKISFINAMAEVSEIVGADVTQLADALGHDARIGRRFLNAGIGFGGGCLPKDIRAFAARAEELGAGQALGFLREVDAINLRRRTRVADLAEELLGGDVRDRSITVLGVTFKPDSDDVRDSPALDVADLLHRRGARVTVTDPQGLPNAARRNPELRIEPSVSAALNGAELVVLATEWKDYTELDPATARSEVGPSVDHPTVIDARNALQPDQWRAAGWTYRGLGR